MKEPRPRIFCCSMPHWVRRKGKLVHLTSPISSSGHDLGGQSSIPSSDGPQKTPVSLSDSFTCILLPLAVCTWPVQDTHFLYLASESTVALRSHRLFPEVEKCVQKSRIHLWFAPTAPGHSQVRGLPACTLGHRDATQWGRSPGCPRPGHTLSSAVNVPCDTRGSICLHTSVFPSVKWGAYADALQVPPPPGMMDYKQVFSWEEFWLLNFNKNEDFISPCKRHGIGQVSPHHPDRELAAIHPWVCFPAAKLGRHFYLPLSSGFLPALRIRST